MNATLLIRWLARSALCGILAAGMIFTGLASAYTLSSEDAARAENVVTKLEKIFEKKPERYRTKTMATLEKLHKKTSDARTKALIRHVIDTLDRRLADGISDLFAVPAEPVEIKTRADLNVASWFRITSFGKWKVSLSWDKVPWATKYNVRYGTKPKVWDNHESETGWMQVGGSTSAAIEITGLMPARRYYFAVVAKNAAGDESSYYSAELSAITPPATGLTMEKRKKYEEWIKSGGTLAWSDDPEAFSYYQKAAKHYWGGQFWLGLMYYDNIYYENWAIREDSLLKAYAYLKACQITAFDDDVQKDDTDLMKMKARLNTAFNAFVDVEAKMTSEQLQKGDILADAIIIGTVSE